jgi:glucokinase
VAFAIGVDVGGTKVAAGVVDDDGHVVARTRRATPSRSPEEVERVIGEVVQELRGGHDVVAVGIGAAGIIDESRAVVRYAPNLAWLDEPLRARVEEVVDVPVVVENDANAMAWAEYRFGAGKGQEHLLCVTVGTGIGGGLVIGGRLYRGAYGGGAEFGHLNHVRGGRRCGCGQRGCIEQYCSGRALLREAREIADLDPRYGARLLELGHGRIEGITAEEVTRAAQEGDRAALECFAIVGAALGQVLADLASALDPGTIVVGGGVADAGELLLDPTRAAFAEKLTGSSYRPHAPIVHAALGNEAGLVGAADLARLG